MPKLLFSGSFAERSCSGMHEDYLKFALKHSGHIKVCNSRTLSAIQQSAMQQLQSSLETTMLQAMISTVFSNSILQMWPLHDVINTPNIIRQTVRGSTRVNDSTCTIIIASTLVRHAPYDWRTVLSNYHMNIQHLCASTRTAWRHIQLASLLAINVFRRHRPPAS